MTGNTRHMDLEKKFNKASALLDAGHYREAFRLFNEAARAGHRASWVNVGYCFDVGLTRVARARDVTEDTREQAEKLLSRMRPLRKAKAGT